MLSDKTKQFIKIHTNRYSNELGSVESKYGKRVIERVIEIIKNTNWEEL